MGRKRDAEGCKDPGNRDGNVNGGWNGKWGTGKEMGDRGRDELRTV